MAFGVTADPGFSVGFGIDVPPQDGDGVNFGLTLQFQSNGVNLGAPNATTLDFGSGIIATRGLSGDPNKISVSAVGGGGSDAESIPGTVSNGVTDNFAAVSGALGLTGSYFAASKPRAKISNTGPLLISGIFDIHPSISLPNDARGIVVLIPGNNLPAVNADGAEAAFIRVPRRSPSSGNNLAFSPIWRGFNIDARGTTQTNLVHGVRIPNPDITENPLDGDPTFTGNKDYVAGEYYNMDIVGFPGSGMNFESSNGRLHLHSVRALNNGLHGFDMAGNDIVLSGHSAAGGNALSGFKVGQASGFLAVTTNVWSDTLNRSPTTQAMWINQRKLFTMTTSEFNDWNRFDGNTVGSRGGVWGLNVYGPFNEIFTSDGVALDGGTGDLRLQFFNGVTGYQSLDFIYNKYSRSTATNKAAQPGGPFGSWMNIGGDLDGAAGTSFLGFIDASNNAMINTIDSVNSGPNIKPWTGPQATFTITIASPGVATSTAHGLSDGYRLALTTTGALPTGLKTGVTYFVVNSTANTFQLSNLPGGTAINTSGSQSGVHTWGLLDSLPYNTRGGGQINHIIQNSFSCETRIGAMGPRHSSILIGLPPTDFAQQTGTTGTFTVSGNTATAVASRLLPNDPIVLTTTGTLPTGLSTGVQYWAINTSVDTFQFSTTPGGPAVTLSSAGTGTHTFYSWRRTYAIEMGDRSQPSNIGYRHAMYGTWEMDQALTYRDNAFTGTTTVDGGSRTVRSTDAYQFFTTAGGGIATYTINLPTDLTNTHEIELVFVGGPIAAITWGVTGGGAIAAPAPPTSTGVGTGSITMRYRRSTNTWRCKSAVFGDFPAILGRTDGNGAALGTLGERVRTFTSVASAIAMTSGAPITISSGSITLTPGVWQIYATFGFSATGSPVVTALQWAISTATNTLPGTKDEAYGTRQFASLTATSIFAVETAYKSGPLAATTTFYPVAQVDFTGGGATVSGYSSIWAIRIA